MKEPAYQQSPLNSLTADHTILPYSGNPDYHLHSSYELQLFMNGNAEYYVNQYRYTPQPGTLFLINDKDPHKVLNLSAEPYERYVVHFPPSLLSSFPASAANLLSGFRHAPGTPTNVLLLSESQQEEFCRLCDQMSAIIYSDSEYRDILPFSLLIQMLVLVNQAVGNANHTGHADAFLDQVIEYIDLHIEEELSLQQIADHLSMDRYYISHRFKDQTGGSLYHYILIKKIAYAKQLLEEGCSVTDACCRCGFNDYNNFIRTFKKHTGVSPGAYRKHLVG